MNRLRNTFLVIAASFFALAATLGACSQDTSKTDLEEPQLRGDATPQDYSSQSPDSLTVFLNLDGHPTIVRVCLDGVAFRTISTSHSQGGFNTAAERVEEWDAYCLDRQGEGPSQPLDEAISNDQADEGGDE